MGIKMDLGSSDSQASSVSRVTSSRIEAYQSVITALSQFSEASSLQGSAYDSGKNYGQSVLTPLLQGAILYSESLGQSVSQLPSKYRAEVGDESLDEEQLTAEIRAYEGSLSSLRGLYRLLERDEDVSPSTLRGISDRMGNIRSHIQTVQEKLNKLRAFAAGSNSVFTDLPAVVDAMNVGLGQIRTQFASFTGQFSIPSSDQLAWTKTIAKEWEKREERIAEADLVKLANGEKVSKKEIKAREKNLYEQFKDIMDSDTAKRFSQLMALLPGKFTKAVLKSDGFWELLAAVENTGAKGSTFVTTVLNGLSKYENAGQFGAQFAKNFSYLQKLASPVKSTVKWGLEKVSGIKPLTDFVTKGGKLSGLLGKAVKVAGKAGTVLTFADLAITGVSSGVDEFVKTKHVGKAIAGGTIDAIKSIGPLEGATIGATIGSAVPFIGTTIGAGAGLVLGAINSGVQMAFPKFYNDIKKVVYDGIDFTDKEVATVSREVGKGIKATVDTISKTFGGIGKALGFG